MLQILGLTTPVFINRSAFSNPHEKTVHGTLWYSTCTEGSTAKYREPEVVTRRYREPYEVFALDSGFDRARYVNGRSRRIRPGHSATPTQL